MTPIIHKSLPEPESHGHEPEDEVEKAILDLQDVKNSYMIDQKEFEKKQLSFKTQEGFYKDQMKQDHQEMPTA